MKKRLLILFFFVVAIVSLLIADAYGLLERNAEAELAPEIGKWNITLNGVNVSETKEITVSDLIYEDNPNVEDGYLAPGTMASYKIVIDPNDTDVAIRYDISIDQSSIEEHSNIVFEVTDENGVKLQSDGQVFTGVMSLADITANKTKELNLSLVWEHDEDLNEVDSKLIGELNLDMIITINFSQYTGESF